jgi:Lsr2
MAQKRITLLVDDLDGKTLKEGKGKTISFALDGREYEIDLSDKNADAFRKSVSRYVDAARKVGSGSRRTGTSRVRSSSDVSPQAVREWAKANKVELSARGRIPQSVIDQFRAAGN